MKTAGVIGGLGPETTAKFYLSLISFCYEKSEVNRPPILLWNVPMNYQIENDLITKGTGEERYIPFLTDAAKRLEAGGADFIVIPCNTVYIFIKEVRKAVKIPVLSIVEETATFLQDKKITKVGLLATKSAIDKKLYQAKLNKEGVKTIIPDEKDQAFLGKLINRLVLSQKLKADGEKLLEVIDNFKKKDVKNVILACTDLQLLAPSHPTLNIYDTMEILLEATVKKTLTE